MKISVLIVTRNRANVLKDCLDSLCAQTNKPYEVILVDNGSSDTTKQVALSYRKRLNLIYSNEETIGRPYARNRGLSTLKGDIVAFLDDDCIADKNWIKNIDIIFRNTKKITGIIGLSLNYHQNNVYSKVEQFFYIRWLIECLGSINQIIKISSGSLVDTKNSAFRLRIIKDLRFSNSKIYQYGDEDVEYGSKLFSIDTKIYFIPYLRVYHKNSTTLISLLRKNYIKGYSWHKIQDKLKSLNVVVKKSTFNNQFLTYFSNENVLSKLNFFSLSIIYVFSYRIGLLGSIMEVKANFILDYIYSKFK